MMKTSKKFIALLSVAALLTSSAFAQTVATDPVGYVTIIVNGSPDGTATAYTPLSLSLENVVLASGALSEAPTSAVLTNSSASYIPSAFAGTDASGNATHYLQFTTGGLIADIIANDATTITTGGDLTGLASSGDGYAVKKHSTLADIFGVANEAGLEGGGDFTASDQVFIMSSDGAGSFATYYYQIDPTAPSNFLGGSGWRTVGNTSTDQSNVVVGPDDGILIARATPGDVEFVVTGSVNAVDHKRDLPAGFSLVAYPYPVDVTLDDSNIYTGSNGYVSGGDFSSSDTIFVLGSNGIYTTYYRQTDPTAPSNFLGGSGWRTVGNTSTDQGAVVIPAGSSIIIQHKGSGLAWSDAKPY
jgi:hypothetical protein